jgi:hypothetical protein
LVNLVRVDGGIRPSCQDFVLFVLQLGSSAGEEFAKQYSLVMGIACVPNRISGVKLELVCK